VEIPAGRAEEARAQMIELFPEGFEEIERPDGIELVAYTDASGEERLWTVFGRTRATDVADGWEERWREFHRPVRVGNLWIGQPWQEQPPDAIAVVIDPGRAFGTGAHPTTRLCLELLETLPRTSLVDVGCGSGVLSIAAEKLGFGPVFAADSDANAVASARENAAANDVAVSVSQADALTDELPAAEVAVANITREVVEGVARRGGWPLLVASGYLVHEPAVLEGHRHLARRSDAGWAADVFERTGE
jgi:ribosomal protein L11 methyltransferase